MGFVSAKVQLCEDLSASIVNLPNDGGRRWAGVDFWDHPGYESGGDADHLIAVQREVLVTPRTIGISKRIWPQDTDPANISAKRVHSIHDSAI
jgi:hypothetical protein